MTTTIRLIRYTTKADAAGENHRLVEQVFAQLAADDPGGVRYAALRLDDGVSFVHLVIEEDGASPLPQQAAFMEFQREIGSRLIDPPVLAEARVVGSYRLLPGVEREVPAPIP